MEEFFTFINRVNAALPISEQVELILRILVACGCGAIIGVERSKRFKEAGIRTHLVVACAAAVLMIVSKYGFTDLVDSTGKFIGGAGPADPSRIASLVVSGVSFLGAGVIFRNGSSIKGLTTAAGIWATAAVGLAVGSGLYVIGVVATVVVIIIQILMHRFTIGNDSFTTNEINLTVVDSPEFRSHMNEQFKQWKVQVSENSISKNNDGTTTYRLIVRMPKAVSLEESVGFIDENEEVKSFSCVSLS